MKLKLEKTKLINLSLDENILPLDLTDQVAGGTWTIVRWTVTVIPIIVPGDGGGPTPPAPPPPSMDPSCYPGEGLPPY